MYPTVESVRKNISALLGKSHPIEDVYKELSIFDWFKDNLTKKDLEQMASFCDTAIALGFNGYVCFKVGAQSCANGMWAHKEESTTGYSPEGDFLYRSFTPDYTNWNIQHDGKLYPEPYDAWKSKWDLLKHIKEVI